jgi:hypothetical protein
MTTPTNRQPVALRVRPLVVAWLLTVGVDLFFNAGLFSGLFDQSREPGLLSDPELFRRIPIAYLGLAIGVAALGWLFDRLDLRGIWRGARIGAVAGLAVACLGIVNLWTALEMTVPFVAAGLVVQVFEFGVAGAFLGAYRNDPDPSRLTRVAVAVAFLAAIAGIVAQNILNP